MDRYKNAKIYRIVCNKTGLTYYGSTCKKLCQRIAQHRTDYKRYLDGKFPYITSFEIIKNGDYDIILVEECPCENKEQLKARERYHMDNNDCVNKNIPNRTKLEYYQDNKEAILKQQSEYYQDNREAKLNQKKGYYQANKEKIKERQNQKFTCECGGCYTLVNKITHVNTKKHQKYLDENYCVLTP